MLSRFEALPLKNKIVLAMTIGAALLLIPILSFLFILRGRNTHTPSVTPVKFEYCEAEPSTLCILSFGRDGAGDAIINFFVPNRKFPDFHLIIKKAGLESRYECKRNSQIKTSVFCSGAPLSLRTTIQIDLHAADDDRLLATGTFLLEAFLVSTPVAVEGTGTTTSVSREPSATVEMTETPTAEVSETSYPNPTAYPYP